MNKKVALINPPYREHLSVTYPVYPLGLGYLQASCTDNNIVCDLFDFSQTDLSDIELINKYQLYEYKIIGITSFSIDFIRTAQFIDKMKTENNYIIVGGHHATQTAGILLKEFSTIDYIIKGYGEKVFPRLVNIIFLNELDLLNGLSGVCFRMNGNIIENEIDYSNLDVEFVSFPSRDKIIFDYNKNVCLEKGSDTLTISSSRGCPYSCTFCVNCKNDYWMSRSENSVIAEIKENILNYDYKTISFVDCNFFVDINRALGILEHIHNNYPNKIITFQLRADQICMFEDVVKRISSYNLLIEVGIEACSLDVLKRYNKMTTPEINQKAIDILKKNKINFVAYMIMFEALEDLSDIRANFNFIKKNKIYSYQNLGNIYQTMFPFYGSKYYETFGEYYEGSIHHRTVPKFVNSDVERIYDFRNRHEDQVNRILFKKNVQKNNDQCMEIANKIILFHYGIFEYLLIMCEKAGFCSTQMLYESRLYKAFDRVLLVGENYE